MVVSQHQLGGGEEGRRGEGRGGEGNGGEGGREGRGSETCQLTITVLCTEPHLLITAIPPVACAPSQAPTLLVLKHASILCCPLAAVYTSVYTLCPGGVGCVSQAHHCEGFECLNVRRELGEIVVSHV